MGPSCTRQSDAWDLRVTHTLHPGQGQEAVGAPARPSSLGRDGTSANEAAGSARPEWTGSPLKNSGPAGVEPLAAGVARPCRASVTQRMCTLGALAGYYMHSLWRSRRALWQPEAIVALLSSSAPVLPVRSSLVRYALRQLEVDVFCAARTCSCFAHVRVNCESMLHSRMLPSAAECFHSGCNSALPGAAALSSKVHAWGQISMPAGSHGGRIPLASRGQDFSPPQLQKVAISFQKLSGVSGAGRLQGHHNACQPDPVQREVLRQRV